MTTRFNFKSIFTLALAISFVAFTAVSCGNDDNATSSDDDTAIGDDTPLDDDGVMENKTTGFVIVGTSASGSALVKYFEEIPDGSTVDISDGTDFPRFLTLTSFDSALFLARPDQGPGFSKYVVNSDGEIELEGNIVTVSDDSFRIAVRDSQTGVFQDRNTPNIISVFNPETLQVTAEINMSEGFVPGDIPQRYDSFSFRGDDLFAIVRGNDNTVFSSVIVHQADLSTNTFVGDTQRDGNPIGSEINLFRFFGQNRIDEQGNLYLPDAGIIDGAGAANPALAVPARVNRILAGSNDFDTDYTFDPAVVLNSSNVFLPTMQEFIVTDNNKAVALVNAETPQEAIDIVTAAGGINNLSPEQLAQVRGVLFSAETAQWCELDLVAQTVTPLGLPSLGILASGSLLEMDGEVYIPVVTATENAYYKYDSAAGTAVKAFDVTGGTISSIIDLSFNN